MADKNAIVSAFRKKFTSMTDVEKREYLQKYGVELVPKSSHSTAGKGKTIEGLVISKGGKREIKLEAYNGPVRAKSLPAVYVSARTKAKKHGKRITKQNKLVKG